MPACFRALAITTLLCLSACSTSEQPEHSRSAAQAIRITHIDAQQGGQELTMHGLSLIGTPYRYGGSDASGFDCSGMIQFVYQHALGVKLPRTAREMAATARSIPQSRLRTGDLVFFNTNGSKYSHVGLYIGNGEFVHAPSSNGTIRVEKMSNRYFAPRYVGAGTFF